MNLLRPLLSAGLFGPLLIASSLAASLTGTVRDDTASRPMANATVFIQSIGRTTSTNQNGEFSFPNLNPGNYVVEVAHLGYETASKSVAVADGADTRADFQIRYGDVVTLEKFVVDGIREGQARALQQKRTAQNIVDVVSADAVGKFPDGNAAESLRRMPGVSVEVDQDEGRYVVLRGIDSALNSVTLNNQLIGTPSEAGNRGVAMDSVPADLISKLEVTKAVTPDMDGNAIGGSINIVTKSAFESKGTFLYGTVAGFYDSFSDRLSPNGSLTYGTVLDQAGKWGVVAGVSYSLKEFQSQTSDNLSWTLTNGYWVPLSQESFNYDIMRERMGVNLALQFRPAPGHELAVRLNHNEFTDEEGRQKSGYEFRMGTLTNQTATSGTNSQGRSTREFRSYHQTGTIDALTVTGAHKLSSVYAFSWQVGGSKGERDVPKRDDWEYRSAANAFPNRYDLSGESNIVTPSANFYDPAAYPFRRVRYRYDLENEDVFSAQVDLKRDVKFGEKQGHWKIGAKYVTREKKDNRENDNYNLQGPAFTLAEPGLAGTPQDSLINREPENYFNGKYRFGPTLDLEANEAFFRANPNRFVRDAAGSQSNSLSGDFEGSEDVFATYLMAGISLSPKLTLLGGVRVEMTDGEYTANELRNGVWNVGGAKGTTDYTNTLPGLHLVWRANDKAVVRFAWTNTMGRPNYSDLAPRRQVDDIETSVGSGVYTGSISDGNTGLKPFESMNFDLTLEYYLPQAGIASIGFFHKDIDNPVYGNRTTYTNVTVDGRNYSVLTVSRPENAKSGKVTGVELNYQQFFRFLPSPLDGLGVNFNYTFVDSEATLLLQTRDIPFFKQADKVGNIALVYEKYGFEARVAMAITGPYLTAVGANADTDIYNDDRKVIDAKVSYRLNKHFTVFAEFLNLNEEPLKEYTGTSWRNSGNEIYYWKSRFGVNFKL